jgi:hypothetical protein
MIDMRDNLENSIKKAYDLNSNSKKILIYAQMYIDYFDLAARKLKDFLDIDKKK